MTDFDSKKAQANIMQAALSFYKAQRQLHQPEGWTPKVIAGDGSSQYDATTQSNIEAYNKALAGFQSSIADNRDHIDAAIRNQFKVVESAGGKRHGGQQIFYLEGYSSVETLQQALGQQPDSEASLPNRSNTPPVATAKAKAAGKSPARRDEGPAALPRTKRYEPPAPPPKKQAREQTTATRDTNSTRRIVEPPSASSVSVDGDKPEKPPRLNKDGKSGLDLCLEAWKLKKSNKSTEALKKFQEAFDLGHASSAGYIGLMYRYGDGDVKMDKGLAKAWFEKAAARNDAFSQKCLGEMYANGDIGNKKDFAKAHQYYLDALKNGQGDAATAIAEWYRTGTGIASKPDYKSALEYYEKAATASQPDGDAILKLAEYYETGHAVVGGTPDPDKAVAYYQKSLSPDVRSEAELALGRLCLSGKSKTLCPEGKSDTQKAVQYFQGVIKRAGESVYDDSYFKSTLDRAALEANYQLGLLSLKGDSAMTANGQPDMDKAADYFLQAGGHYLAQSQLAHLYFEGSSKLCPNGQPNYDKAAALLARVAGYPLQTEQEDYNAMKMANIALGQMYAQNTHPEGKTMDERERILTAAHRYRLALNTHTLNAKAPAKYETMLKQGVLDFFKNYPQYYDQLEPKFLYGDADLIEAYNKAKATAVVTAKP